MRHNTPAHSTQQDTTLVHIALVMLPSLSPSTTKQDHGAARCVTLLNSALFPFVSSDGAMCFCEDADDNAKLKRNVCCWFDEGI